MNAALLSGNFVRENIGGRLKMKLFRIGMTALLSLSFVLINGCHIRPQVESNTGFPSALVEEAVVEADLGFSNKVSLHTTITDALPAAQPGGGYGVSLTDEDGRSYPDKTIGTTGKSSFFLTFYSYVSKETSYKLLQFIDFVETPLTIDNENQPDGFDFTMPENSYVNIPISTNIETPGLHEVLYVFVLSPENETYTEEERLKIGGDHMISYRCFFEVNNGAVPSLSMEDLQAGHVQIKNNAVLSSVLVNRDADRLSCWLKDVAQPNETIHGFVHLGNAHSDEKRKYAILLLKEWKQVDIQPGKKVLFLELPPDREATIPVDLVMPNQSGICDVTPIMIDSPYDPSSTRVVSSFRTGIEIQQQEPAN